MKHKTKIGRPCRVLSGGTSDSEQRRERLSVDSLIQETICQRFLKSESKEKQLTCKKMRTRDKKAETIKTAYKGNAFGEIRLQENSV